MTGLSRIDGHDLVAICAVAVWICVVNPKADGLAEFGFCANGEGEAAVVSFYTIAGWGEGVAIATSDEKAF